MGSGQKMVESKDINLIAIESLIECIDNRDIAEGGIFLDDDNAEFVADILRYHYKSLTSKNKMEEVAKMFGKRLGEHFCVNCCNTKFLLKFTSDGLWVFDNSWGHWNGEDGMLEALLTGQAVILNE